MCRPGMECPLASYTPHRWCPRSGSGNGQIPRMEWYNLRPVIVLSLFEISSGDAAPPQVVEQQDIKPRAALHIQGLLGSHEIRWHVGFSTATAIHRHRD